MGRLCERPGCSNVAAIAYGFDADRLLVWLAVRDPDADPLLAGALCTRHADAMVVPQAWTLDDRREATPRLFRPRASRGAPPPPARTRKAAAAATAAVPKLGLDAVGGAAPAGTAPTETAPSDEAPPDTASTVAAVTGAPSTVDPDATEAIPWLPQVDDPDPGVLAADSPLLARAFRGTDRPR